ncbi:hypothetical protein PV755_45695 [Streptomyces caniscabiei]|uniref:hypothetical protein n=1 Tax=Streptomyces caniscabiei TaxID=2746961 RepID=UPI00299FDF97|nr:hypothetical protein [Streptomyces caniscabiei]MDX3516110.1 hypothetical protein [Streptomyces caniscabiei]
MSTDVYTTPTKLLFEVTRGIGNEQMLAASRLLSQHDDAFWLRQFLEPKDFETARRYERATEIPDVTLRSPFNLGPIQHLRWDQIGDLLREGLPTSRSETAILAVAASLVGEYDINLRDALASLDCAQVQLVITAIADASLV